MADDIGTEGGGGGGVGRASLSAEVAAEIGQNLLTLQDNRSGSEPPFVYEAEDDAEDEDEDDVREEDDVPVPAKPTQAARMWAEVRAARQRRRQDGRRALLHDRFPRVYDPPRPPRRGERGRPEEQDDDDNDDRWTRTCSRTTCRAHHRVLVAGGAWRAPLLCGWVLAWASVLAFSVVQAVGRWLATAGPPTTWCTSLACDSVLVALSAALAAVSAALAAWHWCASWVTRVQALGWRWLARIGWSR